MSIFNEKHYDWLADFLRDHFDEGDFDNGFLSRLADELQADNPHMDVTRFIGRIFYRGKDASSNRITRE